MRRVAITGLGAICALGRTTAEVAESLRQGRSGIAPIESTDASQLRFATAPRFAAIATRAISRTGRPISWTASRSSP